MEHEREAPTLDELLSFAATMPAGQAEKLLARARPAPREADNGLKIPPPLYTSWHEYLADTTAGERLRWCRAKAKTANRLA